MHSSQLSHIIGFNIINGIPVDYMHAGPEGIVKRLMYRWFEKSNHMKGYYIGSEVNAIDSVLVKLKPPHDFTRAPRSIARHRKYWKASEFRNWLLYYSLPLLLHKLPSLYYHHYAPLVCAMHLLLQHELSRNEVNAAEEMLNDFCAFLPELYGKMNCTINAHLLLHLTNYARLRGPLWTHSAFGFENKNGFVKNLSHSKYQVLHQITFNVEVDQTLQLVHHKLAQCEDDMTINFINECNHLMPSNIKEVEPHVYLFPTSLQCRLDGYDIYGKLMKNGVIFCAESCKQVS